MWQETIVLNRSWNSLSSGPSELSGIEPTQNGLAFSQGLGCFTFSFEMTIAGMHAGGQALFGGDAAA